MAFAALVSLAETLSQLLKQHRYSLFLEEKPRLNSLLKHVKFLQAFLEDFPEKANHLEGGIRDAANEAQDILEYLLFEEIRSSGSSGSPHQSGGSNAHRLHRKFQKQHRKLPKVSQDIESIVREVVGIKNSLKIQDLQPGDSCPPTSSLMKPSDSSPPTSSSVFVPTKKDDKKDAMVGFEEDLLAIKTRLCGESRKLQFVPIYGMGGIGKTTLARNAYDDPLIIQHFDIRAWVTVSQDYSIQEMLFTLVDSIKAFNEKFDEEKHSYEQMTEHVYKSLKGRSNGSRIIITTRLQDVAAYADSSSALHEMRFMDMDQSWILLRQKVFNGQRCPPELESIGKVIARSCKGLPLAIVVIAGLLSTVSQNQVSWEDISEKVFPEDYEIHVSRLVKLWMAEGFMKPSVSKSFEEGAEEYLEDLVKRSLVLVNRRKSNGKIKSCKVHDLGGMKDQRRLSIPRSSLTLLSNIYGPIIRTFLFFQHNQRLLSATDSFRLLRILDAVKLTFNSLPDPSTATFALKNLQTLAVVRNFKCTKTIMQMIPNLKKLGIFYKGDGIEWREYHLDNLVHLRQLEKLKICLDDRSRKPFPLWEKLAFPMMLKKLTLSGCLLRSEDMTVFGSLPTLEVMKLIICDFEGCKWETTEGEFPRLKFLKIRLTNLQHWVTDSSHFPSLEQLQLCFCKRLGEIPDVIGEIPTLQIIEVNSRDQSLVDSAKRIKEEQQSFGNDSLQVRIVYDYQNKASVDGFLVVLQKQGHSSDVHQSLSLAEFCKIKMAYAALVSLTQTLSQILKHHQYGIFLDEKQRLKSLHKHVEFLQAFLEDFPEKTKDLEGRIRDAANHAEDIIEYLLFEEIRSLNSSGSSRQSGRSNAHGLHLTFRRQHQKLPGVIGDIESIVTEVMVYTKSHGVLQLC
ncbi:putative late blight resistance proteinR1A-10 [Sesamum alatum]|uniref:Late blight resistance proteinR1A-10 n=1 Tax=Sesamum alatum TaxID=300844 RepID=A0AAE1YMF9_9LAMI|nr:putative late blight resistance proteinR1A-10 [Sesamum alatum]